VKLRALIVDDEREARRRLTRLLGQHSSRVEIAGEAGDGPSAVDAIQTAKPDVVFLDIEMPGLDGFGVLDSLPQEEWPVVVFTTAYGHYAIRAFEVHVLDYLLKPITAKRLAECLARLDEIRPATQRAHLEEVRRENRVLERLMARSGSKLIVVNVKDVIAFESEDKLVFARTPHGRFVLNITMKELEDRLNPDVFCRVHKQAIVQLSHAREVHSLAGGHYLLKLADGSEVQIGRNYSREFRAKFG
jgi:two-component system, LytTR family, response regulator